MIAVDTNILIYAHREDCAWHDRAYGCLSQLAEAQSPWSIPWPCIHEFLSIVTHPRIFNPPTPQDIALDEVAAWLESPTIVLLAEGEGYWVQVRELTETSLVSGPKIHDARIAALCLHHGVDELWSADRDFGRFPNVKVRNPLVGSARSS